MADTGDAAAGAGEEVKPYKIHIPTRHIELTRRKLELTRLPHEAPSSGPWAPKAEVEQLVDFWTEKYSWRDQESVLNTAFPQYRTNIALPSHDIPSPLRIHFIHVRSPHPNALPLLILPPFPFTNLSLAHLVPPLTSPLAGEQAFHAIIPSLPGLGFSSALPPLPHGASPIPATAAILNDLMLRLGYTRYIATCTALVNSSPAQIDYRILKALAKRHASSCTGVNLISPPLATPNLTTAPWEWAKYHTARFFRAGVLGYEEGDWDALGVGAGVGNFRGDERGREGGGLEGGLDGAGGVREANALAYAVGDSPVGMLVWVLRALALMGGKEGTEKGGIGWWGEERIITATMLAWLPGFEHALRFWEAAGRGEEEDGVVGGEEGMSRVGITVFMGRGERYACPAWANTEFDVVSVQRVGRDEKMGLLAFENPGVVVDGVRALAKGLLERNASAFLVKEKGVAVAPLEKVVVVPDAEPTVGVSPSEKKKGGAWGTPVVTPGEEKCAPKNVKVKGKEVVETDETLQPPVSISVRDPLLDGESPDTLVEGSKTPPLDKVAKESSG